MISDRPDTLGAWIGMASTGTTDKAASITLKIEAEMALATFLIQYPPWVPGSN